MMKKLKLNLLVLVTLFFGRIRLDSAYIKEQDKIGSKSQLIQNTVEYLPETAITPVVTVGGDKIDDDKDRGLAVNNFNSNHNSDEEDYKNNIVSLRDKREYDDNDVLQCYSCFANGNSKQDENCFKARNVPVIKCAKGEKCYSELHPNYVTRGCKLKSLLNRTHVCKCPICNNKPFDDNTYYDYKNMKDWKHDNERLEMPLIGIDLICKLCDTRRTNTTYDICKIGKNASFTVCNRNQLCYMNADGESNYVSRGCIDRPTYNSIYFFCHTPLCNNKTLFHIRPLSKKFRIFDLELNAAIYSTSFHVVSMLLLTIWNFLA